MLASGLLETVRLANAQNETLSSSSPLVGRKVRSLLSIPFATGLTVVSMGFNGLNGGGVWCLLLRR